MDTNQNFNSIVESLKEIIKAEVGSLRTEINQRFEKLETNVDQRLEKLETNVNQRFEKLEQELSNVKKDLGGSVDLLLENTLVDISIDDFKKKIQTSSV